jgi:hypothetical protein
MLSLLLAFADSVGVPEHGALLDRAKLLEHDANLVLAELFRHHPHEQFALCNGRERERERVNIRASQSYTTTVVHVD